MRLRVDDIITAEEFKSYILDEQPNYKLNRTSDGIEYDDPEYSVIIAPQFEHILPQNSEYDNPLIFGKNQLEEIVALEVQDDKVFIFLNNGEVLEKPMVYWILSNKKLDSRFTRLEGDLHYKYIRRFTSHDHFKKCCYKYKNADTFQIWNEKESAMIYYGYTMFKGLKVSDVSILSFDIEGAGLSRDEDSQVFLITNTFRNSQGEITKKHFRVDHYTNDKEMIEDWCNWVVEIDPTVITGHNIWGYDFPYLQHCYGGELPLGKYGDLTQTNSKTSGFRVDGAQKWDYNRVHIYGRHIIDGMFLAVRYDIGRKYVSWGLKQIAEQEGLVKPDRQFYDASKIRENWHDPVEREKIVAYGIDDSDDSLALYDLMIPSMFYMTQSVPKPFQLMALSASGAQLNAILVRAYMQENHSLPKASEPRQVGGGISFGIPGIHKNVLKIDVASLYPSIIRSKRLYSKEKDPKGFFLEMVDYFTDKRFEQKRKYKETGDEYYNDLQAASKIFINSSYGLNGTSGLNFNDFSIANEITKTGRQIIKDTIYWATGKDILYWFPEYDTTKDEL